MAGRRVHGPRAGLQCHVLAQDDGHLPVVEGVLELEALEGIAAPIGDDAVVLDAPAVHGVAQQAFGHQEPLAAVLRRALAVGLHQGVFQLRVQRHRLVGGQGPGRGGPDDHGQGPLALSVRHRVAAGEQCLLVQHLEAHVDGHGGLVGVLHLGLGERRAAVDAPVHRLAALVDVAALKDARERAHDIRLEAVIHGEIRVIPGAEHAQALEVGALAVHLPGGVVAAGVAELGRADLLSGLALFALHLQLDGQAVAVPARHIGRVQAVEGARLDDDVLQHLIDGVTDVDLAVGVGRAVVQHEAPGAGAGGAHLAVDIVRLPTLEHFRFSLGQVGLHREAGLRQVQGVFVVGHGDTSCGAAEARIGPGDRVPATRAGKTSNDNRQGRGADATDRHQQPQPRLCSPGWSITEAARSRPWRRRPPAVPAREAGLQCPQYAGGRTAPAYACLQRARGVDQYTSTPRPSLPEPV